jgi:hypothetical protein
MALQQEPTNYFIFWKHTRRVSINYGSPYGEILNNNGFMNYIMLNSSQLEVGQNCNEYIFMYVEHITYD